MSALAERYARSLKQLANKHGIVAQVEQDVELLLQLLDQNAALKAFLANQAVQRSAKAELLSKVFGSKIQELTLNLLVLMARKGRATVISEALSAFATLQEREKGIARGTIISATELTSEQVAAIDRSLSARFGKRFLWQSQVDSSLMAGFRVRIGDQIFDHSLVTQLKQLEKQLMAQA